MLEQALKYARADMPIFPCWSGTKIPITKHGFKDASTNEDVIREWWERHPDANIAFSPETMGWAVLDIEWDGENDWQALLAEEGEHEVNTYQVRTPRGGRHLYYQGSLPGKVKLRLATGRAAVDTRGRDSYVLLPPSRVQDESGTWLDQPYEVINHGTDIAILPDFLVRRTAVATSNSRSEGDDTTLDTDAQIARVRRFLTDCIRQQRVSISGSGGNDTCYQLACDVFSMGVTAATVFTNLQETGWNDACQPPWSEDELARIVSNAEAYRQHKGAANFVAPVSETFARYGTGTAEDLGLSSSSDPGDTQPGGARPKPPRFHFADEDEQDAWEDPEWLIQDLIMKESRVLLSGASGSFKSYVASDIALAICSACKTCGEMPAESGPVVYCALEGKNALGKVRRRAWKAARGITQKIPFLIGPAPRVASFEEQLEFIAALRTLVDRYGMPKLIVFDTLAKVMSGLDEFKPKEVAEMSMFADNLLDEFPCSQLWVAHTGYGKDAQDRVRGSSALPADFHTRLVLTRLNKDSKLATLEVEHHKEADECGPDGKRIHRHFELRDQVLHVLSDQVYSQKVKILDPLASDKIAAKLRDLGVPVGDYVLASNMTPHLMGETPEEWEANVASTERKLKKIAQTTGKVFVKGSPRTWAIRISE
jgi:hypothetical protein